MRPRPIDDLAQFPRRQCATQYFERANCNQHFLAADYRMKVGGAVIVVEQLYFYAVDYRYRGYIGKISRIKVSEHSNFERMR